MLIFGLLKVFRGDKRIQTGKQFHLPNLKTSG